MPGGLPGEILKPRIDWRIDQGNPLQCDLENLAKIFYEFYHRFNYYKDWKIKTIVKFRFSYGRKIFKQINCSVEEIWKVALHNGMEIS